MDLDNFKKNYEKLKYYYMQNGSILLDNRECIDCIKKFKKAYRVKRINDLEEERLL